MWPFSVKYGNLLMYRRGDKNKLAKDNIFKQADFINLMAKFNSHKIISIFYENYLSSI